MLLTVEEDVQPCSLIIVDGEGVGQLAEDGIPLEEAGHKIQYLLEIEIH